MWIFSVESLQTITLNIISSIIFGAAIWFTRKFWIERIINGSYLKMDTERGTGRAARVGNGIQEKVEERHGGNAVKTKRCKKWHRK